MNRKSRIRPLLCAGSVMVMAIAATTPAIAQQDAAPQADSTPDIIVTAQFRSQRLQDTPLAITAVDAALLEARNQDDIAAVARQAPSVTLTPMGGAFGDSMGASIRGIGQFDFNPAYEPGVGLYVDDVYYPTLTGANFDLLDLERVEVLRGPQGTLTGRNSIGGAIKLFSKKPEADPSGFAEVSYGSRNRVEVRAGANFPITDMLFARVSGVHKSQRGYVQQIDYGCANPGNPEGILPAVPTNTDCVVEDLGGINYSGVRGALRYAGEKLDIQIIGDYQYSDRPSAAEVPIVAQGDASNFLCGPWCTYASWGLPAGGQAGNWNTGNRNKFRGWGVSGHIDWDVTDNLQVQSITAYRSYNNRWGTDDDFTPTLTRAAGGFNDLDFWFVSQELRVNAKLGDMADLTVGGYYSDQRSTYFTIQDIRYIIPGVPLQFLGNDPINADSKAVFGTAIVRPVDGMTITGGIRYTEEHKDYTFIRRNLDNTAPLFPDPFGLSALNNLKAVYDGSRVDWRLSVDYRFSPEVLLYGTVGTGFKGGGVTARPFLPTHATQGTFGPETVTAYEIGLKTDLLDRRLRVNLAGFYNDYKAIQLPLSDCSAYGGGPCAVIANAGDGKMWGFEAEVSATPVDNLMIDASLSLIGSEYKSISPAVGSTITAGSPIVSPETQWSAGIQYEIDMGGAGSITPRLDVAYRGRQLASRTLNAVNPDFEYFPSYVLGSTRLTWRNRDRDLAVSFEVTNLFDEYYYTSRFDAVYGFAGTAYANVGAPREWRVSIKKDF
ncbi:iron complex outermembrane receptor protein [Sphingobium sp. B1D7B]|uniref:TonB-dependent receptor n=1 Tax=unclassified Sphingobium TaxID=2611147 RepID=UPI0022253083|nr:MULTISPECIES: TonB-dependent receptor [unclassified Sphingobium]MCW2390769.1 iron complex outermembrane receptor protein [Sphingobium sp. B11D3A]MCW2405911.1 iron complex outermembrane receptor protein [Sphingobium sp. B1D7B]